MTIPASERKIPFSAQIVIAALNEAPGIGLTLAEMKETLDNIPVLVVDGKSSDRTVEIAKSFGAEVVCQDDVGKGDALAKAFEYIDLNVDYIILTDADYTYPAKYVPVMINILEENSLVGMVCGNRFTSNVDKAAFKPIFHTGNKLLALAYNMLNGVPLQDPLTGLRVIRAEILEGWLPKSKSFDIEVELNHLVERRGFTIVEIPICYRARLGEKKLRISDSIAILKRIFCKYINADLYYGNVGEE